MGHLHRFQGCLFPHTDTGTVQEISKISRRGSDIPVQGSALWSVHSTLGVHCGSKGGETDGHAQGYKDPPIPRRLVGESFIPPNLSPPYLGSSKNMSKTGLAGERQEIGAGAQTGFQFCRLPVRPKCRSGQTDTGPLAEPTGQDIRNTVSACLSGPAVHVSDRVINSYREAISPRPTTYETHTMASQKQMEGTRITGKGDPNSQVPVPPFTLVARRGQCPNRPTITPNKACSANLYRRIKRRVGRSFKRAYGKRNLFPSRKQAAYQSSRTQGSVLSLKRVPRPLHRQDRQYHSGIVYKQGRRYEVGSALRPFVENLDLVYQESSDSQGPTYPRPPKRGSGQAIQARPDHPNRVVSPSRGLPGYMQPVTPASNRLICHEVQQQVASICVTSTGLPGHSSRCTQSAMGGSGCLCLPTNGHLGQSGGQFARQPLQENHSDCSEVAQHALVLGSGSHVQSNPIEPAHPAKPIDSAIQSDPSQKSDKPESPCMAPRASAIKEQGFSEAVAARIEAPQRGSTRSVYEAKWALFTKWCVTNQVDFRAPPVNSVADFLMSFFRTGSYSPAPLMVTGQPLLINWETPLSYQQG